MPTDLSSTSPSSTTIYAPATPPGRSALAVIRVSGPAAVTAFESIAGKLPQPRTAALRILRHPRTREPVDQALVLYFPGPATETGEDIVEFQIHGSRAVMSAMLEALSLIPGCRMAEPGEFARRAFYNGKMDLTTIEGLADLIDAETEAQRQQALAQAAGALDRLYGRWRTQVVEAQALVEAAIDFADEGDVAGNAFERARDACEVLAAEIERHIATAHRGEILRSGFKVVLAGPPNAGKSSLLNALAKRDAAIVSAEPGTTRDVVEVRLDLGGIPVLVSDTAGIRETDSAVEQEGVRRSHARMDTADLILWLQPAGSAAASMPERREATVAVATKADLFQKPPDRSGVSISVVTGEGLDGLTDLIVARAKSIVGSSTEAPPTTPRHRHLLAETLQHIASFRGGETDALELRAEDLRNAAAALGRLTGKIDPEEVLGAIFSRFCIGK